MAYDQVTKNKSGEAESEYEGGSSRRPKRTRISLFDDIISNANNLKNYLSPNIQSRRYGLH